MDLKQLSSAIDHVKVVELLSSLKSTYPKCSFGTLVSFILYRFNNIYVSDSAAMYYRLHRYTDFICPRFGSYVSTHKASIQTRFGSYVSTHKTSIQTYYTDLQLLLYQKIIILQFKLFYVSSFH